MDNYSSKPISSVVVQVKSKNIYSSIENVNIKNNASVHLGDIIISATAKSLKDFPEFNSNFDKKIKIYQNINIGSLINLGKGTRIIVMKNADKKSITRISEELKELMLKYIHNELNEEETQNSTFSVTNLSPFNSYLTIPPILKNQSAMISIASEFDSFEILNDKINSTKKFNLTLSYDSRVADCQKALQFLNSIKDILEKTADINLVKPDLVIGLMGYQKF